MSVFFAIPLFAIVAFQDDPMPASIPASRPASAPAPGAATRPASPADARMAVALRAYQLRDYKRAETEIRAALALEPDRYEAHVRLGIVLYRQQKWGDAIPSLERALELKPDLVGEMQVLGHCYYELGNLEKALESYNKTLAKNPNTREALRGLGITLERMGKLEEAEEALRKAVALNPESDTFLLPLGRVLVRRKQYGAALPYLEKAKRLDAFDWEVEYELSRCYKALGEYTKAAAAVERKEFLRVHQESIRTLKTRFLANPNDVQTIVLLATRYDIIGDVVNAEQAWNRAIAVSKNDSGVTATRALSLVLTGNKPAAEKLLRDRLATRTNEAETWEILWFVLKERGDAKGAEEAAARVRVLLKREPVAPPMPVLDAPATLPQSGPAESSPAESRPTSK